MTLFLKRTIFAAVLMAALTAVPLTALAVAGQPSCNGSVCAVDNPLQVTSVCGLLKKVFEGAVAVVTPVAVLFIIWSGFLFVFAQGNPKKLATARRNFYYTIIGVGLFLGAWLIAEVIAATINAIGGSAIISCQ